MAIYCSGQAVGGLVFYDHQLYFITIFSGLITDNQNLSIVSYGVDILKDVDAV